MLKPHQEQCIDLLLQHNVLKFGEFTLKSGRISPYFFNLGELHSGWALQQLARCYSVCLQEFVPDVEVLFGPAYKGIPLVAGCAMELSEQFQRDMSYAFNRKEIKNHGEGGVLVGASVKGKKVVLIDDVLTAGTAIRQSLDLLQQLGAQVVGVVLALNRAEKGTDEQLAAAQIEKTYDIPVRHIIDLDDILSYITIHPEYDAYLPQMRAYRKQYGVE